MHGQQFFAHSSRDGKPCQLLVVHLQNVAQLARQFAQAFGAEEEAYLTGILHDLGKYGELFQLRLQGKAAGIDHWSLGAWCALKDYQAVASAMAIWGHHLGLQCLDSSSLKSLEPTRLAQNHPLNLTLSENSLDLLRSRLMADGLVPDPPSQKVYDPQVDPVAQMLDVRMLFSTLVDADFLDTAAHFGEPRPSGPPLEPERAFKVLEQHLESLKRKAKVSPEVQQMRDLLWESCLDAAEQEPGIFTLTAPTGSGKTLAMLAFALKHAIQYNKRRIIVVIPYLSIIEQTAKVYRDVFKGFPEGYIIEHHSLSTGTEPKGGQRPKEEYLSENWDAPIVITTSVQMLESLFSNRPSACRKLHRIANSVVLFDEVQTLPTNLAVVTLQALSRLAHRYGTTVVFATATQPAFDHLHEHVNVKGTIGWQPREIVKEVPKLFNLSRRVEVRRDIQPVSWSELADRLKEHHQVLCIVNIKRHAKELVQLLHREDSDWVFHLSTLMCPAHRQDVLAEVRRRLHRGERCILISTQCIEAGVDVDFPIVYRAFGPLDSIAQAAGRCNRNGNLKKGEMVLFIPEEEKYPAGAYQQAAGVTRAYLAGRSIQLHDVSLYDGYYRTLYDISRPESQNRDLREHILAKDFVEVERRYRLIPDATINVLVPYDLEAYHQLAEEVRRRGLTSDWIRRARAHVVGVYRPRPADTIARYLEPIFVRGEPSADWYIYTEPSHYDRLLGLNPQDAPEGWIL